MDARTTTRSRFIDKMSRVVERLDYDEKSVTRKQKIVAHTDINILDRAHLTHVLDPLRYF